MKTTLDHKVVLQACKKVIVSELYGKEEDILPSMSLSEWISDSLDAVEFILGVEEILGIQLDDMHTKFENLTLMDAVEYIVKNSSPA